MIRGGSTAAATSKMKCFVIIVNDFKPLTIITNQSILDVAAALDPPLMMSNQSILSALDCLEKNAKTENVDSRHAMIVIKCVFRTLSNTYPLCENI